MSSPAPLDQLIACPSCDALHRSARLGESERAACARCGTLLITPRARSFLHVIALAFTAMILMIAAIFFPFLKISAQGFSHASSVFEVAMAFSEGFLAPLAFAVLMLIVGLPILRFGALIYVLWPLANARPAWPHAAQAFRLAEELEPWSMAEIFIIGTAVALVKIGGLASVSLGPAFWAFCALIIVTALKNAFLSQWTIWDAIGRK
ncbi:paraquat-inducible membrane protein A [Rhodobacter xanthinilyticus]|uniref:Paraquat-inducible membrane protein A n=1 Tax=Rhodobacter xanthinilyticus TaxID=1850250 RepID=A0A1D9M8X7_9RHOB|nr:paraquat-inducible protein A [Rhodobacter xanthinilyticus]AOZ68316.1 paraquat-inducible membrane protein A [Rhodobacter xanthinilyticus]